MRSLLLLFISINVITNIALCLTRQNFYPYADGDVRDEPFSTYNMQVLFPHWSDMNNKIINVVSSGVVRMSGINAADTLDVLIYGISLAFLKQPDSGNIYVKHYMPDNSMKNRIKEDLQDSLLEETDDFEPMYIFTVSWLDVEFTVSRSERSTFQMNFITNGNDKTYLIALVEDINYSANPQNIVYPEFDLRFSYDIGTKFVRTGFLEEYTGTKTKTVDTVTSATTKTNSGLDGRWILDLTNVTINESDGLPSPPDTANVQTPGGISLEGQFSFQRLSVNGREVVSDTNRQLLQEIIDGTRNINPEVEDWLNNLYRNIEVSASIKILGFLEGSLIVNYHVTINNDREKCKNITANECEKMLRESIKNETESGVVNDTSLEGNLNTDVTDLGKSNECLKPPGTFCDVNALCYKIDDGYSYSCVCKDGYIGEGFPETCFKPKDMRVRTAIIIASIATFTVIIVVLIIANQVRKYDLEEEAFQEKILQDIEEKQFESEVSSTLSRSTTYSGSTHYSRRPQPMRRHGRYR